MHFIKFQNLIDLAYIQLATNQTVWPMIEADESVSRKLPPGQQCLGHLLNAPEEIWVSLNNEISLLKKIEPRY